MGKEMPMPGTHDPMAYVDELERRALLFPRLVEALEELHRQAVNCPETKCDGKCSHIKLLKEARGDK